MSSQDPSSPDQPHDADQPQPGGGWPQQPPHQPEQGGWPPAPQQPEQGTWPQQPAPGGWATQPQPPQPPPGDGAWTRPAGPGQTPWPPPQPPQFVEHKHGPATTALVLGIVALAGAVVCVLPIVVGPFAWAAGVRARNEIDRYPGRWTNRSEATAGMVMGIVATVLLVLGVLLLVLLLVAAASWPGTDTGYDSGWQDA